MKDFQLNSSYKAFTSERVSKASSNRLVKKKKKKVLT